MLEDWKLVPRPITKNKNHLINCTTIEKDWFESLYFKGLSTFFKREKSGELPTSIQTGKKMKVFTIKISKEICLPFRKRYGTEIVRNYT